MRVELSLPEFKTKLVIDSHYNYSACYSYAESYIRYFNKLESPEHKGYIFVYGLKSLFIHCQFKCVERVNLGTICVHDKAHSHHLVASGLQRN